MKATTFSGFHKQRKATWGRKTNLLLHLPCVFSLCLLRSDASVLSRRLNAQTLEATCQPTFLGLTQPSLLKDHTPRQASHCLAHINLFGSPPPSLPVTPHPHRPTPSALLPVLSARLHAHAKGSSLPTGHCFHSACVWVSRVSLGPADGSE